MTRSVLLALVLLPLAAAAQPERPTTVDRIAEARSGPLTERELAMARVAWRYFENNTQEETGLANAVNNYPSTTMWDTASYISGMIAAERFGLIDRDELDRRMVRLLATLSTLDLYRGEMPNKVYHTRTGAKVDYRNQPGEIGFSALDLGRMLIWLHVVKQRYPHHAAAADAVVMRWNFCNTIDEHGTLYGAAVTDDGRTRYLQEGRLGYEEYAAKGFQLWGLGTRRASLPEPFEELPMFGVAVPFDRRDPRLLGAHNYVVTESYALDGMEFGWDVVGQHARGPEVTDVVSAAFAQRIYAVQQRRWERTGILTARTEHQLDGPPYFVYDTIYTDGYAWNTITESGRYVPEFAAVAVKGALGLWALWDTPYTDLLFEAVSALSDPEKGFYEGLYEDGRGPIEAFTANNNGITLATLLFKVEGPLVGPEPVRGPWTQRLEDEFAGDASCAQARRLPRGLTTARR